MKLTAIVPKNPKWILKMGLELWSLEVWRVHLAGAKPLHSSTAQPLLHTRSTSIANCSGLQSSQSELRVNQHLIRGKRHANPVSAESENFALPDIWQPRGRLGGPPPNWECPMGEHLAFPLEGKCRSLGDWESCWKVNCQGHWSKASMSPKLTCQAKGEPKVK